jgi:hypothetical protein
MDKETKRLINIALAWCGPVCVLGYAIFWGLLGHNIPPPNMMGLTAEQLVTDYYAKYRTDIEIGMIGTAFFGLFYVPWSMLIASLLRDDDGSIGVLSLVETAGGILNGWVLAVCPAMLAACAFMIDTVPASVIKAMHVTSWIIFDCTYMVATPQLVAIGAYAVLNKRQTVFPAWAGWLSIAVGLTFLPLSLMPFVSEGPFRVPGLWSFGVVFGTYFIAFFLPFNYFVLKAAMRPVSETVAVRRLAESHA